MTTPCDPALRSSGALDVAVGMVCLILLMTTSSMLPLVWDEPNAMERAERLGIWMQLWVHREPEQAPPWTTASIREFCRYTTVIEGHPDFYGFVIAAGRLASSNWLPMADSYRIGPMVLFATAVGFFFRQLRRHCGVPFALLGIASLLTMPRVFAHAHFASIDGPLTACWMLTWAAFDGARRSRLGCVKWGVLLGLTMSCKFTGWLAITGFLGWSLLYRDRAALRVCLFGGLIACLTFVNVNPALWNDPLGGMTQFFWLNTHRASHGLNIPIQFLGVRYDMHHPLPWYNSMAWLVLTVPVGTLLLAGYGAVTAVRKWRQEAFGMSLLIQTAILVIAKALPFAPPHDAERLFLPSFVFLAGLAGFGASRIIEAARAAGERLCTKRGSDPLLLGNDAKAGHNGKGSDPVFVQSPGGWRLRLACPMLCLAVLSAGAETVWYSPQWLCYYSPLVGGVSGAARLGFEPTYYWDGLDREVIQWLESQSSQTARVFCSASPEFATIMNRTSNSHLQFSTKIPGECDWYLVQNRPSLWSVVDLQLVKTEAPCFTKTIRDPAAGFGPWCLDVPIVYVFSREQHARAEQQSRQ